MGKQSSLNGSRLYCPVNKSSDGVLFNLADYRNSRFTSENPDKIIEFYDSFKNMHDLVEWMEERPKGAVNIHEVDGDKEIIVVIPTADFNGKYAKECKNNIFKGLYIIFVESGGRGDFYFNYAHNCNVGIKKAMEYNPKWIVCSNDDMIKWDDVDVLISSLSKINSKDFDFVLTKPSEYHSIKAFIGKPRTLYWQVLALLGRSYKELAKVRKNFCGLNYSAITHRSLFTKLFFKEMKTFTNLGDFFIVSPYYLKKRQRELLDSTYLNIMEDVELSLEMDFNVKIMTIEYLIKDLIGSSLGNGLIRSFRSTAGIAYFNYKVKHGIIRLDIP